MGGLAAALCLVLVLEGLFLFVAPGAWKRMAEQLQQVDTRTLRLFGAGMIVIGLLLLQWLR
ncbi:MAG: DUF2065 family protein [Lysobacteraceae bacterium]|nr:MAG: DUF2065 family protein [Xanthomonadaceae bacterium]